MRKKSSKLITQNSKLYRKGGERMKIKTVKTGKKEVKTLWCLAFLGG